jgi:hypothetical protein
LTCYEVELGTTGSGLGADNSEAQRFLIHNGGKKGSKLNPLGLHLSSITAKALQHLGPTKFF